ncbi:ABC transporter substrate binding protein, partial [Chloroflexota bacterium]
MKKKYIVGLLTSLLVLALVLPVLTGCGGGSKYKIGISQIATHPALDATRQGIIDGMTEAGYVEGEDVDY